MKKILWLLLLIPRYSFSFDSQSNNSDSLYFFTSNLLFVPTESAIFESRVGLTKFSDENLKLDIGVSFDLVGYKLNKIHYAVGVDFFTFSNLRIENNFKFPVDAIDYFFGVNVSSKKHLSNKFTISSRLRISHISSHLQDGHVYERSDTIFTPFIYSIEFINFAILSEILLAKGLYSRNLLSFNYIFHSIPKDISPFSAQAGVELKYFLSKIFSVYISNDLTVASVNSKTNLNENMEAGFAIGKINSRALNLFFTYYDGQDYRGQYYGKYLNYKGFGFKLKF